jgi:predicted ATPase/DNA-binding SARP family transcriptional activator
MFEVRLLGQFEVLLDGKRLAIPTRNAQSLLAYLALHSGVAFRREKLAGLLWPDSSEDNARSNLRHELWRLRKALGAGAASCFRIDDLTITFQPPDPYSLDVDLLNSPQIDQGTIDDLIPLLSVYKGELLPGFYEEWVFVERARLFSRYETGVERLLEALQAEARWQEVLDWSMRWIAAGQWPEPAYRGLMSAYASSGNLARAIATYESLREGLQKDLGVMPSDQTQALYKRLKTGVRNPSPNDGILQKPALPKIRSSNLPNPLTSFIGRGKEIQEVLFLVSKARLVTITGSGGVGKTRLAIEVANSLKPQFKDGVWWVELGSVFEISSSQQLGKAGYEERQGGELVAQALAKVLRVLEVPNQPIQDGIVEHLQGKQLLVVLDNCEHLIDACAALAERLLSECAGVNILTTSREALRIPGEKAWSLPSLTLPKLDGSSNLGELFQSEAVRLFIERTGDMLPGYQPTEADGSAIAQVCTRLDGIPLAIELAAARVNVLSPQEIASRLDHQFSLLSRGRRTALPRHQTLRAAIEWSYDLLSENEQRLFHRLTVFTGSFTLEAAEAICHDQEIDREDVFILLGKLVDKSLLNVEAVPQEHDLGTRFRFLDTICSFGRMKLDEIGEDRMMLIRHTDYYVQLIEAAEPELLAENQVWWFKRLNAEHDNFYAAIEWSTENGQAENALRLVGALSWFWFSHGSAREGSELTLNALAAAFPGDYPKARARALNTAGFMLCLLGKTALARQLLEEAVDIGRNCALHSILAWSLQYLGLVLAYDQELDLADAAFQEGLALSQPKTGRPENNFLYFLGDVDMQKGNSSRAKKKYEDSVILMRAIGNKSFLAYPLRRLGYLALGDKELGDAWNYFIESFSLNSEVGDRRAVAACLTSMAVLAMHLDEPLIAARVLGLVENRLEALGVILLYMDQTELGGLRNQLRDSLDDGQFSAAFEEGWGMNEMEAIEMVKKVVERN